jgi:hypothetical protein
MSLLKVLAGHKGEEKGCQLNGTDFSRKSYAIEDLKKMACRGIVKGVCSPVPSRQEAIHVLC